MTYSELSRKGPSRGTEPLSLVAPSGHIEQLREEVAYLPSWDLEARQLCDTELLLNGAFSPLRGFLTREEYKSVCREMRLSSGVLWPMPIILDVTEAFTSQSSLSLGDRMVLRHPEGTVLGILNVKDMWTPDREWEAHSIFGTTDESHPGVFSLMHRTNAVYLGGIVEGIQHVRHDTFTHLWHTPDKLRQLFVSIGWDRVAAFQTHNPMHLAHVEPTRRAAEQANANLLLHPVVGMLEPGDESYYTRIRSYQAVLPKYPKGSAVLSLLPLALRMAGPREALWHAIIHKNYGCTHLIVGRDHAGPGNDRDGSPFYGPYDAQELLHRYSGEIDIEPITVGEPIYEASQKRP